LIDVFIHTVAEFVSTFNAVGRSVAIGASQVFEQQVTAGSRQRILLMHPAASLSSLPQDSLQLMALLLPPCQESTL